MSTTNAPMLGRAAGRHGSCCGTAPGIDCADFYKGKKPQRHYEKRQWQKEQDMPRYAARDNSPDPKGRGRPLDNQDGFLFDAKEIRVITRGRRGPYAVAEITHLPTGIVAEGHNPAYPGSTLAARVVAMQVLRKKLDAYEAARQNEPEEDVAETHDYTSTACLHQRCDDCRFFCKWCPAPCACDCHAGTEQPYPGYSASVERQLRQDLRQEIAARGITPGPRQAELLVDIVTSVVAALHKAGSP